MRAASGRENENKMPTTNYFNFLITAIATTTMKALAISFLKLHYLEFSDDTLRISVPQLDPDSIYVQSKNSFWRGKNQEIESTLGNRDFCEENVLQKYHDIYFVDNLCNVLIHFENTSGTKLSNNSVVTIKV